MTDNIYTDANISAIGQYPHIVSANGCISLAPIFKLNQQILWST